MNKDKKILYVSVIAIFALLLVSLFVDLGSSRIVSAILLLPIAVLLPLKIKKRSILSINKREMLLLATVFAILYVVLKEFTGLYFRFQTNPYFVTAEILVDFVIPCTVIIIATEIIRYVFVSQKSKFVDLVSFLICVLTEILMYSNVSGITNINRFMDLVGLTLFPAIIANVYYHFVSKQYGALPNISYRLITSLYIYFVPTTTAMSDSLSSCLKMLVPLILLAFVSALYSKKKKNAKEKGKKLSFAAMAISATVIISVAMLISCQFRYGALVIATDSMTGEINKGDMIIYEQYDDQTIEEGQVIIFLQNDARIVHRVVKIENINGVTRYYTKGDANEDMDYGYRTDDDILGLTDIKLAYVGYPTLWLHELISN